MPFSITIVGIGTKKEIVTEELERYRDLVRHYIPVSVICMKAPAGTYGNSNESVERQAKTIYSKWPPGSYTVALSEEGTVFDSKSFAQWLGRRASAGIELVFTIGGAYGLADSLKKRCREIISLSPMTFSHRLCYVLLMEQVYRAFTILKGHPYHK
jgi:23S rRNA (pseudouridine1915-N3)-methyltransferase